MAVFKGYWERSVKLELCGSGVGEGCILILVVGVLLVGDVYRAGSEVGKVGIPMVVYSFVSSIWG